MLIDTHCHLDFKEFDEDRELVLDRARGKGVVRIVNVGNSMDGRRSFVDASAVMGR